MGSGGSKSVTTSAVLQAVFLGEARHGGERGARSLREDTINSTTWRGVKTEESCGIRPCRDEREVRSGWEEGRPAEEQ